MAHEHQGAYGDHSTDGWLEWDLDEHFAQQKAKREAGGDFGADESLKKAYALMNLAETNRDIRRAEKFIQEAGMLAAKEARFHGYEINGWEPESDPFDVYGPRAIEDEDTTPEVTPSDICWAYDVAAGQGALGMSKEEFLALPPDEQRKILEKVFGGESGIGYDRAKFVPDE